MITFDDVSCVRGGRRVLDSVSFTVARGEAVAFVGRSGAGKSSILKLINRILRPSAGRIVIDGRDTESWEAYALRRQTGYVLQEVGLFPHMTIRQNVGVVPRLLGWEPATIALRADELLQLVGLAPQEFGERWPDQLSGGERQRVGVARALAADPPVVLMDEPFGALDPVTRVELHKEFRRIRERIGKTIVLVTHDMREALALADRIGVIEAGRLITIGTGGELERSEAAPVRLLLDTVYA